MARKRERERCDHCRKWVAQGALVIPSIPEKYQDGSVGICEKCSTNKNKEYWNDWFYNKYLKRQKRK